MAAVPQPSRTTSTNHIIAGQSSELWRTSTPEGSLRRAQVDQRAEVDQPLRETPRVSVLGAAESFDDSVVATRRCSAPATGHHLHLSNSRESSDRLLEVRGCNFRQLMRGGGGSRRMDGYHSSFYAREVALALDHRWVPSALST